MPSQNPRNYETGTHNSLHSACWPQSPLQKMTRQTSLIQSIATLAQADVAATPFHENGKEIIMNCSIVTHNELGDIIPETDDVITINLKPVRLLEVLIDFVE